MNRAGKAAPQLQAASVLQILKEIRTCDELTKLMGLPAGDLSRYVNGCVLPEVERVHEVAEGVDHDTLTDELEARVRFDDGGCVNNSDIVFDQSFLDLIAPVVANVLDLKRPDVTPTVATDSITLNTAMTNYFSVRLAHAEKPKETVTEDFIEPRRRLTSSAELTYYPLVSAIDDDKRVLVVNDLIRLDKTRELPLDITLQANADIAGVFTLITADNEGTNRVRGLTDAPVDALSSFD